MDYYPRQIATDALVEDESCKTIIKSNNGKYTILIDPKCKYFTSDKNETLAKFATINAININDIYIRNYCCYYRYCCKTFK